MKEKVKWNRHHQIEELEIDESTPRRCIIEMPVLTKSLAKGLKYEISEDVALIIPLFFTKIISKYTTIPEIVAECYCKRSMWLAYELLNYTDMKELGLPLYIATTNTTREILEPYRQLCEFPESNVLTVSDAEKVSDGYLQKFPLMLEAVSKGDFKRVVSLDASIYFVKERSHTPPFQIMLCEWVSHPMLFLHVWRDPSHIKDNTIRWNRAVKNMYWTPSISPGDYYERAADFVGISMDDFISFWWSPGAPHIEGRLIGLHRDVLQADSFWESLSAFREITYNDQTFLSLYWQRYLKDHNKILEPPHMDFYSKHSLAIAHGKIGFLAASHTLDDEVNRTWVQRYKDLLEKTDGY